MPIPTFRPQDESYRMLNLLVSDLMATMTIDLAKRIYIRLDEAVPLGLIPSKRWFYNHKPDEFFPGFKTPDTAQGHWYSKKSDLVDYIEGRMGPVN